MHGISIPGFNKNKSVPVATLRIPSHLHCMHMYSPSFDQVQKAKYGMILGNLGFPSLKYHRCVKLIWVSSRAKILHLGRTSRILSSSEEVQESMSRIIPCMSIVMREDRPRVQKVIWKGESSLFRETR